MLITLPTKLTVVFPVEKREFAANHIQTEFERLECIHASCIGDSFAAKAGYLKRTVVVVSKGIWQRLRLAHLYENFSAWVVRKEQCAYRDDLSNAF